VFSAIITLRHAVRKLQFAARSMLQAPAQH
jgi:hypothetical protein